MICYRYNQQMEPPAPFVHVALRRPDGTGAEIEYPAQLDTAADKTVVPWRAVEQLRLVRLREIPVAGVGGEITHMPSFLIQATIRQLPSHVVEVLGNPGEPFILLGRDVLNRFRIVLNGPQLVFELD